MPDISYGIQNDNVDLRNYKVNFDKIKNTIGSFEMDNLKSQTGEDFFGLFHESISPLKFSKPGTGGVYGLDKHPTAVIINFD